MAQAEDWDGAEFVHSRQYGQNTLFSQMQDVENRFRVLREHLNGNIPQNMRQNEQEIEDRIEKIRHLQNNIFKIQFRQFGVHEFKAKEKSDDPFNIAMMQQRSKSKETKARKTFSDSNVVDEHNKESKADDGDIDELEIEEKTSNTNKDSKDKHESPAEEDTAYNPFLDFEDENDDEKTDHDDFKQEQYGKYQDILDSFSIEQSTVKQLLKQLKETTVKMKELNDVALGKHRGQ